MVCGVWFWRIKLLWSTRDHGYGYWANFWCNLTSHAHVNWFNPTGLEPDMRCSRCHEDLG